jgi:hypothetical protein
MDCPLQYIGQKRLSFKTRIKESMHAIKYNKYNMSTYAQHVLNTGRAYGNIQYTMETIQVTRKVRYMK